jgi:TP53 regulating kinase-like protein
VENSTGAELGSEVGRGAEAIITVAEGGLRKSRPKKGYRHPELDATLRTSRTKYECRILEKAHAAGIPVPKARMVDSETLLLERIDGVALKQVLDSDPLLAHTVGRITAKLHENNLIHADLTTSNILINQTTKHMTFIDFGLSFISMRDEDKAVDLHLFHQSLESKHHAIASLAWRHFLKGYRDTFHGADMVIERLRKVELRGRNKGS